MYHLTGDGSVFETTNNGKSVYMGEGDREAWEKMQELQQELTAKQHRRNSI